MRQELLDKKKKLLLGLCSIFMIGIVLLICYFIFFKNNSFIKTFEQEYFTINYDDTWKSTNRVNDSISLVHTSTNSIINVKVSKLTNKNRNSDIGIIKEEVRYDINKNNPEYKLINEEKSYLTDNNYECYKLLYECDDVQNLVVIMRNDKYLCVINYTSNTEYFDILLNSAQIVIGSVKLG